MAISKITGSALDKNVIMKDVATADGSSPTLTLQTGDTDIAADDVLGTINFQAPDEATGTDAILVAAGIAAVSEGDFSSSSNATKLVFKTGASEAATEKMSLSSAGNLTITTADNSDQLTLKSTDADANSGPSLSLTRDSGSPADNDAGGKINFNFDDDAGNVSRTAAIFTTLVDASDGSEDGKIHIETMIGGSEGERFGIGPTEVVVNEASVDLDFRVEGNGDANLLFVDASTDRVGIGKSGPSELLDVDGTLNTTNLKVGGAQGSDGQVLTSTGSGVGWESPAASGSRTLIGKTTLGSAGDSITVTGLSSTYTQYEVFGYVKHNSGGEDGSRRVAMRFFFGDSSGNLDTNSQYRGITQSTLRLVVLSVPSTSSNSDGPDLPIPTLSVEASTKRRLASPLPSTRKSKSTLASLTTTSVGPIPNRSPSDPPIIVSI
jgi:hypothetical protein